MSHFHPVDTLSRSGAAHPNFGTFGAHPCQAPLVEGIDAYGECRPAQDAAGDFFELVPLLPAGLALSVGQVTAEGVSGRIVMSGLRALWRALMRVGSHGIGRVMRELNHSVWLTAPEDFSATMFCACFDPVLSEMQYVNAGQDPALLIRRRTGRVHRLESTGAVLGLSNRVIHGQRTLPLEPGDLLIAYTDGIADARDADGCEFRESGILSVVERHANARACDLTREILEAVERHTGRRGHAADRTVVVVRFKGTSSAVEPQAEEEVALAAA